MFLQVASGVLCPLFSMPQTKVIVPWIDNSLSSGCIKTHCFVDSPVNCSLDSTECSLTLARMCGAFVMLLKDCIKCFVIYIHAFSVGKATSKDGIADKGECSVVL